MPSLTPAFSTFILASLLWAAATVGQETQDVIEGEPAEHEAQIMIAEADGSKLRMLMKLDDCVFQGSSEWSRDGKVIAFDCRFKGKLDFPDHRIGFVNADGTNPRVLGDGMMPTLSPQGNRLAYSRSGQGVWMQKIRPEVEEPTQVDARGWGTAWSPDGTRLAYASFSLAPNITVLELVEGTRFALFDAGNPYQQIQWNFCWSPDSKQIAFKGVHRERKSVLSIVDARGASHGHKIRVEAEILPTLTWSADGTRILYSADRPEGRLGRKQIYEVNPLTMDPPKLLSQQAANRQMEDMCFSPDGSKISLSVHPAVKK